MKLRLRLIGVVYRKELLETLRDRRTLFLMLLVPILLYPLIFLALGALVEAHVETLTRDSAKVAVWGRPKGFTAESLTAALTADKKEPITLVDAAEPAPNAPGALCDAARRALAEGHAQAIVLVDAPTDCQPTSAKTPPPNGPLGRLTVLFDATDDFSADAASRVEDRLAELSRTLLQAELKGAGRDPALAVPLGVARINVASQDEMGGHIASRILPLALVIMAILGAFYPAIDLTAGEKERGTLETLLCTPVRPMELLAGKYLAVVTISMVAATVNLASVGLTVSRMVSGLSGQVGGAFSLGFLDALLILSLLLPTALLFSAAMLGLATLARDFKEAQNLMTPVFMVCVMPAALAGLPGIELTPLTAFLPGLNITLAVREVLSQKVALAALFAVIGINLVYTVGVLALAGRLFISERVVFGAGAPLSGLLGLGGLKGLLTTNRTGQLPGPAAALGLFAVTLVLLFHVGAPLQANALVPGLLITEYALVLGAALAVVFFGRFDWRRTLGLNLGPSAPHQRRLAWLGGLCLACSSFAVAACLAMLSELLFPQSQAFAKEMKAMVDQGTAGLSTPLLLLVFAVTPAICEELAFRGLILTGLRGLGRWPALLAVSALFGAFHLSLYRFLPTAILGGLITYAVWQSGSVLLGMLIHAASNGMIFAASRHPELGALVGLGETEIVPARFLPWLLLLPVGLVLLHRAAPRATRWHNSPLWDDEPPLAGSVAKTAR